MGEVELNGLEVICSLCTKWKVQQIGVWCVCVCVCVAFWCVVLSAVSQTKFCTIDVTENIAVLCHYAASIGNSLPMFRDNTLDGADKSFRNVGNELSLLAA